MHISIFFLNKQQQEQQTKQKQKKPFWKPSFCCAWQMSRISVLWWFLVVLPSL